MAIILFPTPLVQYGPLVVLNSLFMLPVLTRSMDEGLPSTLYMTYSITAEYNTFDGQHHQELYASGKWSLLLGRWVLLQRYA